MNIKILFVLVVVALVATAALVTSQSDAITSQSDATTATLMKAKAGYAHRLLDAVVMEDFDVIQDQAFRLKAVAETADWRSAASPEFQRETDAFIHASERLFRAAKERNGDGAALAYMDVTLSCVHCHRHLRSR